MYTRIKFNCISFIFFKKEVDKMEAIDYHYLSIHTYITGKLFVIGKFEENPCGKQ